MKQRTMFTLLILMTVTLFASAPAVAKDAPKDNPFFQARTTPFQAPPFDRIAREHFLPAFREGMRREKAEIDAIADSRRKRRRSPTPSPPWTTAAFS